MSSSVTLGIDFGATKCCVYVMINGRIQVLEVDGSATIPSVVSFKQNGEILVGKNAKACNYNICTVVRSIKRLICRSLEDECIKTDKDFLTYKIDGDDNRYVVIPVTVNGKTKYYTPVEISSMILKYIRQSVERKLKIKDIKCDVVITVPAYYNDDQRRSTIEAGRLAGLNVLRVINEPTAAAIAYGYQYLNDESKKDIKTRILVYDFGGGTFDVSIIEVDKKEINVLATGGDDHLGGEDITNNLVKYYIEKLRDEADVDISNDNKKLIQLRRACEEAKISLSVTGEIDIDFNELEDNDIDSTLGRDLFVEINKDIFNRTIGIVNNTLNDGDISKDSIDDIVLVGGSSRIPEVEKRLARKFPKAHINKDINPEEAVAKGALICGENMFESIVDISTGLTIESEGSMDNSQFFMVKKSNDDYSSSSQLLIHQQQLLQPPPLINEDESIIVVPPIYKQTPGCPDGTPSPSPSNPYPCPDNPNPVIMNNSNSIDLSDSIKSMSTTEQSTLIHTDVSDIECLECSIYNKHKLSNSLIVNDVLTHAIGRTVFNEKGEEKIIILVSKNTKLPFQKTTPIKAIKDNQKEITFTYCESKCNNVKKWKRIKTIHLKYIPENKKGDVIYNQIIHIDRNGLITITIEDAKNKDEKIITTIRNK